MLLLLKVNEAPNVFYLHLSEIPNSFETIEFWNICLHNFGKNPTFYSNFYPVYLTTLNNCWFYWRFMSIHNVFYLDLSDIPNNFETIAFWNIGLHIFGKNSALYLRFYPVYLTTLHNWWLYWSFISMLCKNYSVMDAYLMW